ncbi:hypothetical protein E4U42_005679 [Claviceps africana]|uniref:Uncharacterized protein n=1 Tax=Claviceps africana TaxID=83212 RepID=A0A8K0J4C6_9HYPO|nr:hypothetical protein E4U42_005679 [Claviceps africana]
MHLKRKRSEPGPSSPYATSISSPPRAAPSGRTLKRHRDDRPPEEQVHRAKKKKKKPPPSRMMSSHRNRTDPEDALLCAAEARGAASRAGRDPPGGEHGLAAVAAPVLADPVGAVEGWSAAGAYAGGAVRGLRRGE